MGTVGPTMSGGPQWPATPQFVVVAQDSVVQPFSGTREQRELASFLEDLDELWEQRPDLTDKGRARRAWGLLAGPVKKELRTQGLGAESSYSEMVKALKTTYGDRRPVSQLTTAFFTCRQEGYESVRSYSQRLHDSFLTLRSAQRRDGCHQLEPSQLPARLIEGLQCQNTRQWLRQSLVMRPEMSFLELRELAISMQAEAAETVTVQAHTATTPAASEAVPNPILEQLLIQMTAMANQMKLLTESCRMVDSKPPTPAAPPRRTAEQDAVCYRCQKKGHFARNCQTSGNERRW